MLKKNLRLNENRLSKQMNKIADVGIKIEVYFQDSYQKCANLEFTENALEAFRSVRGLPGNTAIEMHRDIDKHLEAMQIFLNKWDAARDIDKKTMKLGKRLHNELVQLKNYLHSTNA